MDSYPAFSLNHNIPLLITLGLPSAVDGKEATDGEEWTLDPELKEQATLLRSELPVLEGDHALQFSRYITAGDVSGPMPPGVNPWRGRASSQRYRYRIRTAGRTYYLPPRRARLPENFDISDEDQPVTLHSPFSPLSPSCRLYPDGIIDAHWVQKHQEIVPSVFLCFYSLTSDPSTATLQDNKIKSDINAFRTAVQRSGYKARVAVAVFADETSASSAEGIQERLENIRKGSGVDSKLFFAMSSDVTEEELQRVAENMLTTIYAPAMEYYRELGRHARKKRGRSSAPQPSVPPTSGTSQTLSLAGWHIRYDLKAAIFAEFRQEPDTALRLFDQAYETLLGPDVFEVIPNWSPRWNEARMLADILAVRSLRSLLMGGQYSAAVRRWETHRARIRSLIDSRGRGSNNYGWQAWEARWAVVMADLINRVGVRELRPRTRNLFLLPEKGILAERLAPWELLHHPGYWYRTAARHTYARRSLAQAIPEDDRRPPDFSPASQVASRAFTYDDYMCPPPHKEYPLQGHGPGVDHSAKIVTYLETACDEFLKRRQTRMAAEVALECGREYTSAKKWQEAIDLLGPLWISSRYKPEAWFNINEELAWTLRAASLEQRRSDLLVAIDWELLDARYTRRPNWHYDVSKSLPDGEEEKVEGAPDGKSLVIQLAKGGSTPPSFLSASFVFKSGEGKAGQVARAQLTVRSNAFSQVPPIVLDELHIHFDGTVKPLILRHSEPKKGNTLPKRPGSIFHSVVHLEEEEDEEEKAAGEEHVVGLHGSTDLTLHPQSTLVLEVAIPLREAGDARAVSADFYYHCQTYQLELTVPFSAEIDHTGSTWYLPSASARVAVARADSQAIHILPRPPKLDIKLLSQQSQLEDADGVVLTPATIVQYYTNEPIDLAFAISNGEDADASVKLDVLMYGEDAPGFTLLVAGDEIDTAPPAASSPVSQATPANGGEESSALLSVPLGTVATTKSLPVNVRLVPVALSTSFDLTLRAVYHLVHDPATPITQELAFKLSLSNPFEANYDLLPRLHPDPWPSLFDHEGILPADHLGEDASGGHDVRQSQTPSQPIQSPRGLSQAWALVTRYASFAAEDLRVVDLDVIVQPVPSVVCRHTRRLPESSSADGKDGVKMSDEGLLTIKPQTMEEAQFDLVAQKASLDHRDSASLDASFMIKWQRLVGPGGDETRPTPPVNTTTLPIPRLSIFGSEPRVLAAVSYARRPGGTSLLRLDVAIENASNHFLTFGLSMEPSNDFAFSGAKLTTLHVLPLSRRMASYRLVPLVRGAWIKPGLVVRDKYFQKVLRILPTEGMKLDKDGILIWVPPEEEEEEEGAREREQEKEKEQ